VRVWKGISMGDFRYDLLALSRVNLVDGEYSQVIVHPAISVWAVSAMPMEIS
ncbi:hypothetical protein BS47DRAFT_1336109, partial [Hydnum rufescens UP504]